MHTHDWIELPHYALRIDPAIEFVTDPAAGGIATFTGITRAEDSATGHALAALDYQAYDEMALKQLHELANNARQRWPVLRLAILHRIGRVHISEPSVIIAVSCPHRAPSFDACRWLIDSIKKDVAIWKKEVWADGTGTWVHPDKPMIT